MVDNSSSNDEKQKVINIMKNKPTNVITNNSFKVNDGKYFSIVFQDDEEVKIQLAPKTQISCVYLKNDDKIDGLTITKLTYGKESINHFGDLEQITLSSFDLSQAKAFFNFIETLDLKSITEHKLKLQVDNLSDENQNYLKKELRTLLSTEQGKKLLEAVIAEDQIDYSDILMIGARKRNLEIFEKMKNDSEYWKQYASNQKLDNSKEETVWQYFFEKNSWIFGYGLSYKYQTIRQREAHIGTPNIKGKGDKKVDFLLADNDFITFVEIKKPNTKLFHKNGEKYHLSSDLFHAISQILAYKAQGQIKFARKVDNSENGINQKAYDSKVILIIGSWAELNSYDKSVKEILKETFELFRQNNRNIKIITYDELYDRAKFIVDGANEK